MDQEEPKTEAPVKPTKTRTPRKSTRSKAAAAAPEGDAGTPAASPAPEKVRKPRAPRRKKEDAPAVSAEKSSPIELPAAPPQPEVTPERHRTKSKSENVDSSELVAPTQPLPAAAEQKAPAPAPKEEVDIPEPPAEFRKPDPVPGFAMPEIVGGNEGGGNNRRKRRRNRNRNREENNRDAQQNAPLSRIDPDELNRRAWKIFLGEVTEEGLALMDDRTAAEASRRAFKVAEIFLLEAVRHRPAPEPAATAEPAVQEISVSSSVSAE